jgi:serine/threonine-protein kinase
MAPERFTGKVLDSKSDVYAVGITLFQMLTGKLPFDPPDPDPLAVAMLHLREPPPPIRQLNPEVSPDIESVVLQALRKKPEKRPSCYELGAALSHAAGGSRERMKSGLGPIARLVAAVRDVRADAATGVFEVRSAS